jgi:nickel-dependent lactate racemase
MIQKATKDAPITESELSAFICRALRAERVDGGRLLIIIPDSTRSMPMPVVFRAICAALMHRVASLDFLIALGTHPPMTGDAIRRHLGISTEEREGPYAQIGIYNHEWRNPDALGEIGRLGSAQLAEISDGLLHDEVPVAINRRVLDCDMAVVVGPVFPHEVVGFSGGNKYFFPGVAGAEILNMFHWLGALITNPVINGTKYTPVRAVIDTAAAMIPVEKRCLALNVSGKDCHGIFYGTPEEAWSAAVDLAATTHIVYKHRPYKSVLAVAPEMYDEIWVAGKCMYKLEPVVADGGELVIYGPHIRQISVTHGDLIRRIGYHTRDYFLARMDQFADVPGGILAHSTHVRGIGTYENGEENCRIRVTLATGIPREECAAVNLGYRDPASINVDAWRNREDEGYLLVEHAGEVLYRLTTGNPVPARLPARFA